MDTLRYESGFGSYFETESVPGSLPLGRNSPKQMPKGLYAEQLSGSSFTMKRSENLRSWLYRIQPSVCQGGLRPSKRAPLWKTGDVPLPVNPNPFRWLPAKEPQSDTDFLESLTTMVSTQSNEGCAVHNYNFTVNSPHRFLSNADGELLLVPEKGVLLVDTEFGSLEIEPQEIAVIPRGVRFRVLAKETSGGWCRGYIGENRGEPFRLPDLGPLGSNGLAQPRDFLYPRARYWDEKGRYEIYHKFEDQLWQGEVDFHPLNVVAWHGNYAPYKYDLRRFNTMGTVSFDHPDPSIYTVLTSPSAVPGQANCDFVIFPPRWLVGENTFRPPYYHRNFMSEYMGLVHGVYDAKEGGGFFPGGASLHNRMTPHGPDRATFDKAIASGEAPVKVQDTMAFMFETRHVFCPSEYALSSGGGLDPDYEKCWDNLVSRFGE